MSNMSNMSSSSTLSLDHHHHLTSSEQLCYLQCNLCHTALAVYVPICFVFLATLFVFSPSLSFHPTIRVSWQCFSCDICVFLWWFCGLIIRWVFHVLVCSKLWLFDAGTAPISCQLTQGGCFCLLLISFITLATHSSLLRPTVFW